MVRVIYLLSMKDLAERKRLIQSTLRGEKWKVVGAKGKVRDVTDRKMVDLSQQLQGWTQSFYRIGCTFVHLSDFHNHFAESPSERLSAVKTECSVAPCRGSHGGPLHDNPNMEEFSTYLPQVFEKMSGQFEMLSRTA